MWLLPLTLGSLGWGVWLEPGSAPCYFAEEETVPHLVWSCRGWGEPGHLVFPHSWDGIQFKGGSVPTGNCPPRGLDPACCPLSASCHA